MIILWFRDDRIEKKKKITWISQLPHRASLTYISTYLKHVWYFVKNNSLVWIAFTFRKLGTFFTAFCRFRATVSVNASQSILPLNTDVKISPPPQKLHFVNKKKKINTFHQRPRQHQTPHTHSHTPINGRNICSRKKCVNVIAVYSHKLYDICCQRSEAPLASHTELSIGTPSIVSIGSSW